MVFTFELCSALCSSWFHFIWCITSSTSSKHGTHSQKNTRILVKHYGKYFACSSSGMITFQTHLLKWRWLLVIEMLVVCWCVYEMLCIFHPNEIATVCWHCVFDFNVRRSFFFGFGLFAVPFFLSHYQIHTWHRYTKPLISEAICAQSTWNWRCKVNCRQSVSLSFIVVRCVCACVFRAVCYGFEWFVLACAVEMVDSFLFHPDGIAIQHMKKKEKNNNTETKPFGVAAWLYVSFRI